jgi:hypothetical protein
MDATIENIIGVLAIMGGYIWLKVWIYNKEYKENKSKGIKRGSEWD